MPLDLLILVINFVSTLFLVGLIWFVQIVHYPLFKYVGKDGFVEYQHQHQRLTTWVVAGPMLLEALTAGLLILVPPPVNIGLVLLGGGLLIVIWTSTPYYRFPVTRN